MLRISSRQDELGFYYGYYDHLRVDIGAIARFGVDGLPLPPVTWIYFIGGEPYGAAASLDEAKASVEVVAKHMILREHGLEEITLP